MSTSVSNFSDVFDEELHEIRKRREASGQWGPESENDDKDPELKQQLTGLALSGGGVRSAAFNLGLMQSLYKSGRLKLVDYLSTVSGGGYCGALLSSELIRERDGVNWDGTSDGSGHNRLSVESRSTTGQSRRVFELALYGRRMSDGLKLLSRHLAGWVTTILFLLSGIVCIASILAWMMRKPWDEGAMSFLPQLGFSTDVTRAFFPAFLAMLFWMFTWLLSAVARGVGWKSPPATRLSYVVLIVTLALSFFSFLAIKDVGFDSWTEAWGLSDTWKEQVNNFVQISGAIISAIFVAIVLPFLMPKTLLQSGTQRSKPMQRLVFNFSGYGVLFGVPLIVFYLMCGENISGRHEERIKNGDLATSNLRGFRDFAEMLRNENTKPYPSEVKRRLWNAISGVRVGHERETTAIREWIKLTDDSQSDSMNLNIGERWVDFFSDAVIFHQEDKFSDRLKAARTSIDMRRRFAEALTNDCLSDPSLFPLSRSDDDEKGLTLKDGSFDRVLTETWLVPAGGNNDLKKEAFHLISYQKEAESIDAAIDSAKSEARSGSTDAKEFEVHLTAFQRRYDKKVEDTRESNQADDYIVAGQALTRLWDILVARRKGGASQEYMENAVSREPTTLWAMLATAMQSLKENRAISRRELTLLWEMLITEREILQESSAEDHAEYISWLKTMEQRVQRVLTATRRSNWVLLQARFPDNFTGQDAIYASVVNTADQQLRLTIAWWALILFLIIGVAANMNTSCLHGVYRDQISGVWLVDPGIRLKDLDTCKHGGPLHLINCTMNHLSSPEDPDPEQRSRFVLSSRFCGSRLTGYRRTESYQEGETTVADAIAISGAAVATSAVDNMLYRIVLLLTNFRTGQWVRNPARYQSEHYWPSPLRVILIGQRHFNDLNSEIAGSGG